MFTAQPLAPGTAERLLRAANRAPSAGFSLRAYSFLVLEGKEEAAPSWQLLYEQTASEGTTKDDSPEQVDALSTAPLVMIPLASKDVYLERYARPSKGWTDRDEARMPIPYWYIDTGFTALLMLLAAVDEARRRVLARPTRRFPRPVRRARRVDADRRDRGRPSRPARRSSSARRASERKSSMNWSTAAGGDGPSRALYATSVNRLQDETRRQAWTARARRAGSMVEVTEGGRRVSTRHTVTCRTGGVRRRAVDPAAGGARAE